MGTIQEIRDGRPRREQRRVRRRHQPGLVPGRTAAQTWWRTTPALQVDLRSQPPQVNLTPSLPADWPELTIRTKIGEHDCLVRCRTNGSHTRAALYFDGPVPEHWIFRLKDRGNWSAPRRARDRLDGDRRVSGGGEVVGRACARRPTHTRLRGLTNHARMACRQAVSSQTIKNRLTDPAP